MPVQQVMAKGDTRAATAMDCLADVVALEAEILALSSAVGDANDTLDMQHVMAHVLAGPEVQDILSLTRATLRLLSESFTAVQASLLEVSERLDQTQPVVEAQVRAQLTAHYPVALWNREGAWEGHKCDCGTVLVMAKDVGSEGYQWPALWVDHVLAQPTIVLEAADGEEPVATADA